MFIEIRCISNILYLYNYVNPLYDDKGGDINHDRSDDMVGDIDDGIHDDIDHGIDGDRN